MKKHLAILIGAASLIFGASVASAQQRMPLPTPPNNLQTIRFPASASQYHQLVEWYVSLARQLPARFNVAPGDADLVVLLIKDCASRVEADGVVTKGEYEYCKRVTLSKVHELMVPYVLQQRGDGH